MNQYKVWDAISAFRKWFWPWQSWGPKLFLSQVPNKCMNKRVQEKNQYNSAKLEYNSLQKEISTSTNKLNSKATTSTALILNSWKRNQKEDQF